MGDTGPEPDSASRRRRAVDGWVTGGVVALAFVHPVHWAFLAANLAFTGCLATCGQDTNPILGTWMALAITVMVLLPVAVGRAVSGRAGPWAWSVMAAAAALPLMAVVWPVVSAYLPSL